MYTPNATIYRWVHEYTKRALKEMESQKSTTGAKRVVDEMQVNAGGEKYRNWNCMDGSTRYVLASHLSKRCDARQAKKLLRKAQANAGDTAKFNAPFSSWTKVVETTGPKRVGGRES